MDVRAEAIFMGKVQGVWFRANTRKFAVEDGVVGTVRNLPDGSVEAVFEGKKDYVESVIYKCANRQPMGEVTSSKVRWTDPTGDFSEFSILR